MYVTALVMTMIKKKRRFELTQQAGPICLIVYNSPLDNLQPTVGPETAFEFGSTRHATPKNPSRSSCKLSYL